ncbi:RsmB/NOP family class I SAM-dependent RNA methyltransferase [Tepidamorphus sp. 3E244]|uniref:RsmB/NOP family class I SAM-dependent RNA methyltransferase n=1 Tax=Tepidamorphus sp. 3E244 TaxID=3385498 RepID=UPI0038FCCB4A
MSQPPRKPAGRPPAGKRPNNPKPARKGEDTRPARTHKAHHGLVPRRIAADIVDGVLFHGRPFDATLDEEGIAADFKRLTGRDRALTTMISQTALRQLGFLRDVVSARLQKPLPKRSGRTLPILIVGAAQILFLDIPAHAAVDMAVRDAAQDLNARHFRNLVNAILRAIAREADTIKARDDKSALNTPDWLAARWRAHYGDDVATAIMASHGEIPPLDFCVPEDADAWAEKLGGKAITPRTVRLGQAGRIAGREGFEEGRWWVQDVAATLPVQLLGDVAGLEVADLAAAPGGKTMQLAALGARVTAVDRSASRMARLSENLKRLNLKAETVVADLRKWDPQAKFDAILLDAPCSATGTIRRHPDIPWLRGPEDFAPMAALQTELLTRAAAWLKPGGKLVFATCSLEREEGEGAVAAALAAGARLKVDMLDASEVSQVPGALTADGFLRTRPDMAVKAPDGSLNPGLDGFFAARLISD